MSLKCVHQRPIDNETVLVQVMACRQAITWTNTPWLTHWGPDKMGAMSQTTFSSAFSWMKLFEFRLKFQWSLFLRVTLTIFQLWRPGDRPLSEPMMVSLLTHICVTRPQWVIQWWPGSLTLYGVTRTQWDEPCLLFTLLPIYAGDWICNTINTMILLIIQSPAYNYISYLLPYKVPLPETRAEI